MGNKHIKDLLSSYHDDALAASERRRVDAHVEKCKECREELEDLRKVSKMVAGLPEHELPGGFLERLRARRRREEDAGSPRFAFPIPMRSTALALTGLFACMLFFREVKYRLTSSEMPAALQPSAAMDAKMLEAFPEKQEAADGLAGGGGAPASPALPGGEQSDNEALRKYNDQQARAMGIAKILPPSEDAPASGAGMLPQAPGRWDGIQNRPMNREEAKEAMRQMTKNLYEINQQAQWKRAPSVPIRGRTPQILGKDKRGVALGQPAPAAIPAEAMGARSIAYTGVNASGMLQGQDRAKKSRQPALVRALAPEPAAAARESDARTAPASYEPASFMKDEGGARMLSEERSTAEAAETAAASMKADAGPARIVDWTRAWSSRTGGIGTAGGAVLKEPADWVDMHRRVGFARDLPPVDFSKEMVVGIFADRSTTQSRRAEIVSILREDGRLLIRYRIAADPDPGAAVPSAPYHIVIIPRSDLPFSFIQAP